MGPTTTRTTKQPQTVSSSESESESSDDDNNQQQHEQEERAAALPSGEEAAYDDYRRITIPRRLLALWCNEPFFDKAILNCYVRLGIGPDKLGKPCYRLCKIIGIETKGSFYKFPNTQKGAKPVTTNKVLRLEIGENKRSQQMIQISDHKPTHAEVSYFISQCKNVRSYAILSKKAAVKILKEQTDYVNNYVFTNEDIEKNIQSSRKKNVIKNVGRDIARIELEVQSARSRLAEAIQQLEDASKDNHIDDDTKNKDDEENIIEKLTKAVNDAQTILEEKLQNQKLIIKADVERKRKLSQSSKVRNWMKVNAKANAANKKADLESYKYNNINQGKNNKEEEKKEDVKNKKKQKIDLKKRLLSNKNTILDSHNQFAIDEEYLALSSKNSNNNHSFSSSNNKASSNNTTRVRKGISFLEYLERKENGTL